MTELRKIIHVDMDAFYASVEQRDNPSLRGKPVVVGGPPGTRSVVSTCSYEARRYGIHSAMPSVTAYRLCPHAVFLPGRYEAYAEVSEQIHEIFRSYTDKVEPLALDEAYLDVTCPKKRYPSATAIAKDIRTEIFHKTGLTASAGVSYNKFLAKTASEYNKPNGLTIITPQRAQQFIDSLDIRQFYGIGSVTAEKLRQLGIYNGYDLRMLDRMRLMSLMGKLGNFYYNISRGMDYREVESHRIKKSLGREITLEKDTLSLEFIQNIIKSLVADITDSLHCYHYKCKTVTLKIKYHDFVQISRSTTFLNYTDSCPDILKETIRLLNYTEAGIRPLRLVGASISSLDVNDSDTSQGQLCLPFQYKEVV